MLLTEMAGTDLVAAARAGDQRAFELLIEPLLDPGYRLAQAMLGDRQAAEDAVQESALRAWRAVGRLRSDTADLRPWFMTIVANNCRSQTRARWWHVIRLGDHNPEPHRSASRAASTEDTVTTHQELLAAMRRLSTDQRLALALRYYMDLPLEEVAAVLGVSTPAARSRVHRALHSLRPHLDAEARKGS